MGEGDPIEGRGNGETRSAMSPPPPEYPDERRLEHQKRGEGMEGERRTQLSAGEGKKGPRQPASGARESYRSTEETENRDRLRLPGGSDPDRNPRGKGSPPPD
jgi:hypothetical protein